MPCKQMFFELPIPGSPKALPREIYIGKKKTRNEEFRKQSM
jgi:hypothetical protein